MLKSFNSPCFDSRLLTLRLEKRRRVLDEMCAKDVILPWSVYDAAEDGIDARPHSDRYRGQWWHRTYGQMTRMYCVSCGKPSPYAVSESLLAVFYKCDDCVFKFGEPPGARRVPIESLHGRRVP